MYDLSASMPEKVAEMRQHLEVYRDGLVEAIPGVQTMGPDNGRLIAMGMGKTLIDGHEIRLNDYWADAPRPPFRRTSIASEAKPTTPSSRL